MRYLFAEYPQMRDVPHHLRISLVTEPEHVRGGISVLDELRTVL